MKKGDLHHLISSLTSNEKRIFRQNARQHKTGSKEYLELFDFLNKQKVYDHRATLDRFGKNGRQVTRLKNYLYNAILRNIGEQSSAEIPLSDIRAQLNQVDLLISKELNSHCIPILNNARKEAEKIGATSILLEIMKYRIRVYRYTSDYNMAEKINKELSVILKAQSVELNAFLLNTKAQEWLHNHLMMTNDSKSKPLISNFQQHFNSIKAKAGRVNSTEARIEMIEAFIKKHRSFGENERMNAYGEELCNLFESNPAYISMWPNTYYQFGVYARMWSLFNLGDLKQIKAYILKVEKLRSNPFIKRNNSITANLVFFNISYRTLVMIVEGKVAGFLKEYPKMQQQIEEHRDFMRIPFLIVLYSNMVVMLFQCGRYRDATRLNNAVLGLTDDSFGGEVLKVPALTFEIINHFEIGNIDLAQSRLRYLIKKINELTPREQLTIKFLKNMFSVQNLSSLKNAFKTYVEEMEKVTHSTHFTLPPAWMASKIHNLPLSKVFTEAYKNRGYSFLEQS